MNEPKTFKWSLKNNRLITLIRPAATFSLRDCLGVWPSLPLSEMYQSGAENRTPRRWRECRNSLSQRERVGERESA